MERKVVIRTIIVIGAPKWVDATLEKSACKEGILQNRGGGEMLELGRKTFYLEDTVSPKQALEELAEAVAPVGAPAEPITTDEPPAGQES